MLDRVEEVMITRRSFIKGLVAAVASIPLAAVVAKNVALAAPPVVHPREVGHVENFRFISSNTLTSDSFRRACEVMEKNTAKPVDGSYTFFVHKDAYADLKRLGIKPKTMHHRHQAR